jgi:hypothetical protein
LRWWEFRVVIYFYKGLWGWRNLEGTMCEKPIFRWHCAVKKMALCDAFTFQIYLHHVKMKKCLCIWKEKLKNIYPQK